MVGFFFFFCLLKKPCALILWSQPTLPGGWQLGKMEDLWLQSVWLLVWDRVEMERWLGGWSVNFIDLWKTSILRKEIDQSCVIWASHLAGVMFLLPFSFCSVHVVGGMGARRCPADGCHLSRWYKEIWQPGALGFLQPPAVSAMARGLGDPEQGPTEKACGGH
jgi:hypothetical protein